VLGSFAGYGYYWLVGCRTGACGITSDPVYSTVYGMFLGLVISFNGGSTKEEAEAREKELEQEKK
jgi:hypothetical protein